MRDTESIYLSTLNWEWGKVKANSLVTKDLIFQFQIYLGFLHIKRLQLLLSQGALKLDELALHKLELVPIQAPTGSLLFKDYKT